MNPQSTLLLLAGTLGPSLIVAWAAGFVVRRQAGRWGLVAVPGEHRAHAAPTPLGGGLAIWLGVMGTFAAGQVALWVFSPHGADHLPEFVRPHMSGLLEKSGELWLLLGCATLLMLVGLIDDRRGLDWRLRLAAQTVLAWVAVYRFDWNLTIFIGFPFLADVFSMLWIVALVNAFNMLDNMDGLSAGVAAIAGSILAAVLLATPDPEGHGPQLFVVGLLLVTTGSLVGFLWHNRPPARLFMGDAGSYFLGYLIAVASMLATYSGQSGGPPYAVLAPLCVLAVPLYDLVTVVWIRLRAGRSPFAADNNHFSHRLVQLGLTRSQAVATIYLTTATCGMGALLLHQVKPWGAIVIMLMVGCVLAIIAILERTARRRLREQRSKGAA